MFCECFAHVFCSFCFIDVLSFCSYIDSSHTELLRIGSLDVDKGCANHLKDYCFVLLSLHPFGTISTENRNMHSTFLCHFYSVEPPLIKSTPP